MKRTRANENLDSIALSLQRPPVATLQGKAHIKFSTILQAQRLAAEGAGWSVDDVIHKALDLLEQHRPEEMRSYN